MSLQAALPSLAGQQINRASILRIFLSLAFLVGVMTFVSLYFGTSTNGSLMLVAAAVVGGYMALNIGANDVANNVGPSVGSGALTMAAAVALAGVFEILGALVAGGDVVGTIKSGIIDPSLVSSPDDFVWLMLAALFSGALWLNIATYLGAPVSTTHSIVGGLLGAGIAAGGWQIANWGTMLAIAASWIISPVLGGSIAALLLYATTRLVFDQRDLVSAARRYVPVLLAAMAWAFCTYLALKGLKKIWQIEFTTAVVLGLCAAVLVFILSKPRIAQVSKAISNDREGINSLFTLPLIFGAALLSFAHGANDVANAIGPLAAISDALSQGGIAHKAEIPLWVMIIGALGIGLGLALFGPKLIRTVGSEITLLDKISAFCIALSAAVTVIFVSQFGLPVSSTHIAVGGVCGVGFLREYLNFNRARLNDEIGLQIKGDEATAVQAFVTRFQSSVFADQATMIRDLRQGKVPGLSMSKKNEKAVSKVQRQHLVKRALLVKIAAAWVITIPASGLIAALMFFAIRGFMLP